MDFVGEVAEETVESLETAWETDETMEAWEADEETQDWDFAAVADDPLFDEGLSPEEVPEEALEEVFEDVSLDVLEDDIFFADAAEESQFLDSIVGAEIVSSGACGENVTWTLDSEGTLTISGTGRMKDYGYGESADYTNNDIKKVIIKHGVTSIGSYAFFECTSLTSVTIGNSVTIIEFDAFYGCTSLTSVTIGNSVASIGDAAFSECTSLPSVTIPDSVTTIGEYAFQGCSNLPSVTIPASVTSIGAYAFYDCVSLTSVTIGNSVSSIGINAFCSCSSLKNVMIPVSVTAIGEHVFGYVSYYYNGHIIEKIDGFTIFGVPGSCAEKYAKENDIPFNAIDSVTPTPTPTVTPSITFPRSTETVYLGYTLKLEPIITNSTAIVIYKSSKISVAKVDTSGNVTPVAKGTTYITASIKEGKKTYKATCKIMVKKPVLKFPFKTLEVKKRSSIKLNIEVVPATKVKWSVKK